MYESVAELPEFVGTAWRAESGYSQDPGTTVADIIRFEREELGNEYPDISDELLQNLDHYSASDAVWVNHRRKDCLWYLSEGESEEAVGRVHLPKGSKIITPDYCGGYLVLRGLAEPMLRGSVMAEPWQMTRVEYETAYGKPKKSTTLTGGFSPHKEAVAVAVNQGKPVPPEVLKDYPDLAKSNPGDERLLKVAIEREPLRVAKQLGYEVHRLSPKDVVDKDDYARGYRYRLSKADPTQPYPQIVMARNEGEVAIFLKKQVEGGNPMPRTESERLSFHETIFGKGSVPPLATLKRGMAVNKVLPMPPESGPPLPRALGLRWPWKK